MEKIKYASFNKTSYETHRIVLNLVKPNKKILDLGCATGYFAKELREKNCITYGVEINKAAALIARKSCKKVYTGDIENLSKIKIPYKFFDYILLLDILEHLKNPQTVLKEVVNLLKKDGEVIIAIPNFAHISVRFALLFGNLDYSEAGILDKNHLRFFTKKSFLGLLKNADLKVKSLDYSADFGQIPFLGRFLKKLNKRWQYLITRRFNSFLAIQFIGVCGY